MPETTIPERVTVCLRGDIHERVKRRSAKEGKTLVGFMEQLLVFGMVNMGTNGKLRARK